MEQESTALVLKVAVDGVIIPVGTVMLIYTICQALKDFLSSTLIKWILKLLGKEEWVKYFPYILPLIVGFIAWYDQNPNAWQDGLTLKEIWQFLVYLFGAQVLHKELRKLGSNGKRDK